jgi:hypothetical protein
LLDNACRWAGARVRLTCSNLVAKQSLAPVTFFIGIRHGYDERKPSGCNGEVRGCVKQNNAWHTAALENASVFPPPLV